MDNKTATAKKLAKVPTHRGNTKRSVVNPSFASKRPRPYVTEVTQADLNWDPTPIEQFINVDGEQVRAGDSFAICRPGMERWPLGHVSDVYRATGHRHTTNMILEAAADRVESFGNPLCSGHGYRVVHQFAVKGENEATVHGLPVTSRLTVVHDHTGLHALKARMCVYVGDMALGSIVGSRAIHVSENPEKWRVEVEGMVDRSAKAQDALLALLTAADTCVLGEADKAQLTALGVRPAGKDGWRHTLLDSMVEYHRGAQKDTTWGVWERRMTDDAIMAMVRILGRKKFGKPIDEALGGHRYGGK